MTRKFWIGSILTGLCLAGGAAMAQDVCDGVSAVNNTSIKRITVATGLDRPMLVTAPPGDVDRIFFIEKEGLVSVLKRGAGTTGYTTFLNIISRVSEFGNEMGLLGMAFDPEYATNGYFYVHYTNRISNVNRNVVSRFSVSAGDPDIADASSEVVLFQSVTPQSNHNGGHIEFGPDNMLYIGIGDGGGANDQGTGHAACGNGQDNTTPLAKLLRINPRTSGPDASPGASDCSEISGNYTVPADNPFVDGSGGDCDEIWASGLRNPWRFAFDSEDGGLFIADVGQNCWEEIDWVSGDSTGGENYGWRPMEANHCFNTSQTTNCNPPAQVCSGSPACGSLGLVRPVLEYSHTFGCSITGGRSYRGCRMPNYHGRYFYGDYCNGYTNSFVILNGQARDQRSESTINPGFGLTSFGHDAQGEMYIVDESPGQISKISPLFTDFEVSGINAESFLLDKATGAWTWEDLEYATMHDVDYYRVYRGEPNGVFSCITSTLDPTWADGGDPIDPADGELLAYLVTAVDSGQETLTGEPARTLADPCGAP
jgi:glucose/arabinose dehydrogenase